MSDSEYERIRRRVEKRIAQRREFTIHLTVYILVNLLLWMIWSFLPQLLLILNITDAFIYQIIGLPWPLLIMFGWGIGLIAHGLTVYYESGAADAARERAVQREIEKEQARLYGDAGLEKPKRRARLSDDGELIYEDEEEADEAPARRRSRRR